jgi:7-cyano-7-deazaguanine synthase
MSIGSTLLASTRSALRRLRPHVWSCAMVDAVSSRTILLSGGIDSACLLALCAEQDREEDVDALFVDYGQAAAGPERRAAVAVAASFGVRLREAQVSIGPIPEGEIPGRNALLVHLALSMAGRGPLTVMLGIHAGTGYRDCSPEFVTAMQVSLDAHRGGTAQLAAPFANWTKVEIYAYADAMSVPVVLTYSCDAGTVPPCGACPSCRDRKMLRAGQ